MVQVITNFISMHAPLKFFKLVSLHFFSIVIDKPAYVMSKKENGSGYNYSMFYFFVSIHTFQDTIHCQSQKTQNMIHGLCILQCAKIHLSGEESSRALSVIELHLSEVSISQSVSQPASQSISQQKFPMNILFAYWKHFRPH